MPDILALLTCLHFELNTRQVRQFSHIISALLAMSGRITMKGMILLAKYLFTFPTGLNIET